MVACGETGPRTGSVGASQGALCGTFPSCPTISKPYNITNVVTGTKSHHSPHSGLSVEARKGEWGQEGVWAMVCEEEPVQSTYVDSVMQAQNPSKQTCNSL